MNAHLALTALLPEHLLLAGIVGTLLVGLAGRRSAEALLAAGAAVAAAALAAAWLSLGGGTATPFPGQFSTTPAGLMAKAMVLALALPVLLLAHAEAAPGRDPAQDTQPPERRADLPALLLCALFGACILQSADSMLTLFLGLEILSMPVYVLVLLGQRRTESPEAALKYLVLGGTASAMLLMGASLLYGHGGSLALDGFGAALASASPLARAGTVLVLLAIFLKAAIVPFHAWAPDAYQGAGIPATAFMAVVVKAAVLLAAVRLFGTAQAETPLLQLLVALPLASIVWGNLAAMRQDGMRRLLAYSSIAHAGYLMLALLGAPAGRLQAVAFYLLSYGVLTLLALAALPSAAAASTPAGNPGDAAHSTERDALDALQGLFHRQPLAALLIGLAMLSLAGMPPFPGFVGKFLIFKTIVEAGHTTVAVLGLLGSFLGLYAYLRVLRIMFMQGAPSAAGTAGGTAPDAAPGAARMALHPVAFAACLACLAAAVLVALAPGWVLAQF